MKGFIIWIIVAKKRLKVKRFFGADIIHNNNKEIYASIILYYSPEIVNVAVAVTVES